MSHVDTAYEQILARFVRWAQAEENVKLALLIGSRARTDHPADEWSDADILLFADDPGRYEGAAWLDAMGSPILSFDEPAPDRRGRERRALFAGGLDVDFVPLATPESERLIANENPGVVAILCGRGVRVLVDKIGFSDRYVHRSSDASAPARPGGSELGNVVNDFWYHCVWTSKHLRRGELWLAKSCCDSYLKDRLGRMIAWHAETAADGAVDTWFGGRFLEDWADPAAVGALERCFAHYDVADVWRALQSTMDLFSRLARETAKALGYEYPAAAEAQVRDIVDRLRVGKPLLP